LLSRSALLESSLSLETTTTSIPDASTTVVLKGRAPAFAPAASADPLTLSAPFTPAQIRHAYTVDQISFNGTAGDGTGQTIAIIDAYHTPSIISDAAAFSTRFSLPQFNISGGPTLTVLNQSGGTTPPANVPSNSNWDLESSLDVQWAHAMAPGANIVLFESNSSSFGDLFAAVSTAAAYPGVTAVSMSFGSGEFSSETFYDGTFRTPNGHPNVTFTASTGDDGKPGMYPAYSPNVVAVGGTSLTINNDSSWGGESGWSGGGGGISLYESQPSYQSGKVNGLSSTKRTIPDISMDANPNTGVYVLDTNDGGWFTVGGTSLSSPMVAGLVAITNQGRALAGLDPLDGRTQTLPLLYNQPASMFHDVTTGNNGFAAGAGYDLVTGIGSPIGNLLVPALADSGSISGTVFQDSNSNSVLDPSEPAISNATVYVDLNGNQQMDSGEPRQTTGASGSFTFNGLLPGSFTIREVPPPGYIATGSADAVLSAGSNVTDVNLPTIATGYTGTSGNDNYLIRLSADGTQYQILVDGTLTYTINRDLTTRALTFNLGAGDDTLAVDYTNGDPITAGGIIYSGGTSNTGDTLEIIGAGAADPFTLAPFQVLHGSASVSYANVQNLMLDEGQFNVSSDQSGLNLTIGASASANFASSQSLGALNVSGTAAIAAGGDKVLSVSSLAFNAGGTLDLTDNDLVVRGGSMGTWNGSAYDGVSGLVAGGSIHSSLAESRKTTAGIATALQLFGATPASWSGQTVNPSDVLVKFTYTGDANLDGKVNIDDYGRIDANVGQSGTVFGWYNGDFNFDGKINIDDYGLIDSVIGAQGPVL
jgi:hypothetical protein